MGAQSAAAVRGDKVDGVSEEVVSPAGARLAAMAIERAAQEEPTGSVPVGARGLSLATGATSTDKQCGPSIASLAEVERSARAEVCEGAAHIHTPQPPPPPQSQPAAAARRAWWRCAGAVGLATVALVLARLLGERSVVPLLAADRRVWWAPLWRVLRVVTRLPLTQNATK